MSTFVILRKIITYVWFLGVVIGMVLVFVANDRSAVFLFIGLALLVASGICALVAFKTPNLSEETVNNWLWASLLFYFGALAMFVTVGARAGLGKLFNNLPW